MVKYFLLSILFLGINFGYCQSAWELKKNEDGIRVYTRETTTSAINEFKAEAVFKTTLDYLVQVITDAENLKQWNYKTSKSRLLERTTNNTLIIYMYNDFGWLVKDRDHISELTVVPLSKTTIKITINSLPTYLPETANAIRIEEFSGFWLLEKIPAGIRVTQQMYGNPKGHVPALLVNATLAKAPLHTFTQLKKLLEN